VFNISCYYCFLFLLFQCKNVWPDAWVLLCLWHVQKAWVENAIKKIINPQERSNFLSALGRIIYSWRCPIDAYLILWVEQEIEMLLTNFPNVGLSFNTLKNIGCKRRKCGVLETTIYHMQGRTQILQWNHSITTLKWVLYSSRKKFIGHQMDWFIYHLVGDVLTHY
jgi:hypothetical protein